MAVTALPPLAPQFSINRPLTILEYYFASIGRRPASPEGDCEIIMILEGEGRLALTEWEAALALVVTANPGCRLRISGKRQHARWQSDGAPTRLRYIEHCAWDGQSNVGAEFVKATRFDLERGPMSELIIVPGTPERVIFRAHHAAMDGMGVVHFFQELFRALRGEPLLGTNAAFSDDDLMMSVRSAPRSKAHGKAACLTGGVQGVATGNVWRRLSVRGAHSNLIGKLAVWVGQFARRYSEQPVRILLPVNLRRHCPGLLSMLNFTGLLLVGVAATDGPDDFRSNLRQLLDNNVDAHYTPAEYVKWLPLTWLDWIGATFVRHDNAKDTAGISNFGVLAAEQFSCAQFSARTSFLFPALDGNSFIALAAMRDTIEITVGMPSAYASNGRLDAFMEFLAEKLQK